MRCEKCGGSWIPPKDRSKDLDKCPFCGTPILNVEKAKRSISLSDFLQYIVSVYGTEIYRKKYKLYNLIADLYICDERLKRVYRRAILDDSLSLQIYELSLIPKKGRNSNYNHIIYEFIEGNLYDFDFGRNIINEFLKGLNVEISTRSHTQIMKINERWIEVDDFGVQYDLKKKILIKGNPFLKSYKIKEGTVSICDKAFYHNRNLEYIDIPDTVINIGKAAFKRCYALDVINIPNSVMSIGDSAFSMCFNLSDINIPNSVTNIGHCVFYGCSILNISFTNTQFTIFDDAVYTSDLKTLKWCYYKKKYSIGILNSVKNIEDLAFYGCNLLYKINLPNSVENIGNFAFCRCEILSEINMSNTVVNIGNYAFYLCKKLRRIDIPYSVIKIGDFAFAYCGLLSINLKNPTVNIGKSIFKECHCLENINIPMGTIEQFKEILEPEYHYLLNEVL